MEVFVLLGIVALLYAIPIATVAAFLALIYYGYRVFQSGGAWKHVSFGGLCAGLGGLAYFTSLAFRCISFDGYLYTSSTPWFTYIPLYSSSVAVTCFLISWGVYIMYSFLSNDARTRSVKLQILPALLAIGVGIFTAAYYIQEELLIIRALALTTESAELVRIYELGKSERNFNFLHALAKNGATPQAILSELAYTENPEYFTYHATLRMGLYGISGSVLALVAVNQSAPQDALIHLGQRYWALSEEVKKIPWTDAKTRVTKEIQARRIGRALAQNQNTPKQLLQMLSTLNDSSIRADLEKNPSARMIKMESK